MSPEQLTPPSFEQSPPSRATPFEHDDEIRLHMSNYAPIEDARAAIQAAIASVQANSLEEAIADDPETLRLAKIRRVYEHGDILESVRVAYQQDNFDLTRDEKPTQDMFSQAS